jgi:hypothetical protein
VSDDNIGSVVVSVLLFVFFAGVAVESCRSDIGHEKLGSHGHSCFANHTCRDGLRCLRADGIEPTCVKP